MKLKVISPAARERLEKKWNEEHPTRSNFDEDVGKVEVLRFVKILFVLLCLGGIVNALSADEVLTPQEKTVALTLLAECKGEKTGPDWDAKEAMYAVASVIRQRMIERDWSNKAHEVCTQPYQFSCWNKFVRNKEGKRVFKTKTLREMEEHWYETRYSIYAFGTRGEKNYKEEKRYYKVVHPNALYARELAKQLVAAAPFNRAKIGFANHYHNKNMKIKPSWTTGLTEKTATIGNHAFWKVKRLGGYYKDSDK